MSEPIMTHHSIAVLLSYARHPTSQRAIAHAGDARALALAIDWMGAASIRALTVGAMPESAARDYLAQGITAIECFGTTQNSEAPVLEALLQTGISNTPWIFTGIQSGIGSNQGQGEQWQSGLLPYLLAEALRRPLIDRVVSIQTHDDGVHVEQALSKGARRHLTLTVPAVLTIHPKAHVSQTYAAQAAHLGKIIDHGNEQNPSVERQDWIERRNHARTPLKANFKKSGHERMLSAIGNDSSQNQTQVIQTGSVEDRARAVLDYLQQHGLLHL